MVLSAIVALAFSTGQLAPGAVRISAAFPSDAMEVGRTYAFRISFELDEGFSLSEAGLPAPILQIKPPKSVKLVGKVLKDHKDLARNEFLRAPFERAMELPETQVEFAVRKKPGAEDAFFLNVLAYVADGGKGDAFFVRRRLRLPLEPGAPVLEIDPDESDWGQKDLVQIGEQAPLFTLPAANHTKVSLKDHWGEKNVIVTTYRAYW